MSLLELYGSKSQPVAALGKATTPSLVQQLSLSSESVNQRPSSRDYVHISVTGEDDKPLILVLTSFYPINWRLNVPDTVIFDKIILVR
jgi:hypothetical protein